MRFIIGGGLMLVRRKEFEEIAATNEQRCDYDWLTASHKRLCEDLAFQYDIGNYLRNQLQDLTQVSTAAEDRRRIERKAAFTAGKFHSAGGYAHALMLARKEVSQARLLLARWRPLVRALETTPGQFTGDDSDSSDIHAAADFFIIGQHVMQERSAR
jgi:hypothetical protein